MPSQEAARKLNESYCNWKEKFPHLKAYPAKDIFYHIGDKWSISILSIVSLEPYRFGALQRAIPNISQRILTQSLTDLQKDGLINRTVYPTKPPSVEYSLTPLGQSLILPLWQLVDWANVHHDKILHARERFIRDGR